MSKDFQPDPVANENQRRWEWAWKATLFGVWMLPVMVIGTVAAWTSDVVDPPWTPWAMMGFDVVVLAVISWAVYFEWKNAVFEYVTEMGMAWGFVGKKWYSAPERMHRFEKIVKWNLEQSEVDWSEKKILSVFKTVGSTVVEGQLPNYYEGVDTAAQTSREEKTTLIEGEYSRDLGTMGWEIMLQIFPYFDSDARTESEKKKWMKEKDILPLEAPNGTKDPKEPLS